jgi:isopentenyldiphosphate isomerase
MSFININDLKTELGISNKEIAEFFGFKNTISYLNSSAKKRYENALCEFYVFVKGKAGRQNIETNNDTENSDTET